MSIAGTSFEVQSPKHWKFIVETTIKFKIETTIAIQRPKDWKCDVGPTEQKLMNLFLFFFEFFVKKTSENSKKTSEWKC